MGRASSDAFDNILVLHQRVFEHFTLVARHHLVQGHPLDALLFDVQLVQPAALQERNDSIHVSLEGFIERDLRDEHDILEIVGRQTFYLHGVVRQPVLDLF